MNNTTNIINIDTIEKLFEEVNQKIKEKIENKIENNFDLRDFKNILESYNGEDWKKYCKNEYNTPFDKILICKNGLIEIFVIVWNKKSESMIHDHPPEYGCLLKVLCGELKEEIYECKNNDKYECVLFETNELKINNIGFRIGNVYLHKIKNETDNIVVSLHIYSKPNFNKNIYKLIL